jgi:periplasmic divalent cation tolerance protein
MRSVYRWEGAVEEAEEAVMILKTRADCVAGLEARIRDGHPYEVPCVVALPVSGGSAAYLAWVAGACGRSLAEETP